MQDFAPAENIDDFVKLFDFAVFASHNNAIYNFADALGMDARKGSDSRSEAERTASSGQAPCVFSEPITQQPDPAPFDLLL